MTSPAVRRRTTGGNPDGGSNVSVRRVASLTREDQGILGAVSSWISSIPNLLTEEVEHNAPRTTSTVSLPDTEEVLGAVTQQVDLYSRKVFEGVNHLSVRAAETLSLLEGQLTHLVSRLTGENQLSESPAAPARRPPGPGSPGYGQDFAPDFAYHLGGFYTTPVKSDGANSTGSAPSSRSDDLAHSPDTETRKQPSSAKRDNSLKPSELLGPGSPVSSDRIRSARTPTAAERARLESNVAQLQQQYERVLADLQDTMSRVSQLQQENLELKAKTETEPEPDLMQDVIQSQLQTLMTERARLAEENARLSRENAGLQELLEFATTQPEDAPSPLDGLVYLGAADACDSPPAGASDPYRFVSRSNTSQSGAVAGPATNGEEVTSRQSAPGVGSPHTPSKPSQQAASAPTVGVSPPPRRLTEPSAMFSHSSPNPSASGGPTNQSSSLPFFRRTSPLSALGKTAASDYMGVSQTLQTVKASAPAAADAGAAAAAVAAFQLISDGESSTDDNSAPLAQMSNSTLLRRISMKPVVAVAEPLKTSKSGGAEAAAQ